jgi:hypothetical protein
VARAWGVAGAGAGGEARRRLRAAQLLATLNAHDVDFVIIGGYALAPHGVIRATKDIDIVPEPGRENIKRLAAALRALQARADIGDVDPDELGIEPDEAGLREGGNWVLQTRFGRLDVMQDVPGLRSYTRLRDNAVVVDGTRYSGYDDLIGMKTASGRDEDLRDIATLEAARKARGDT